MRLTTNYITHLLLSFLLLGTSVSFAEEISVKNSIEKTYSQHYPKILGISPDGLELLQQSLSSDKFSLELKNISDQKITAINIDAEGHFAANFSTDGKKIAYFIDPDGRQNYKLKIFDITSGKTVDFSHKKISNPMVAWSKDSQFLAYLTSKKQIAVIDLNNEGKIIYQSKESLLARTNFAWADNTNSIAFAISSKPDQIQIQNLDSKSAYQINLAGKLQVISWLKSSDKLVVAVSSGENNKIYEVDQQSSNAFNIPITGDISKLNATESYITFTQTSGVNVNTMIFDKNLNSTIYKNGSIIFNDRSKNITYLNLVNFDSSNTVAYDLNTKEEKVLLTQQKGNFKNYSVEEPFIRAASRRIPGILWKSKGVEDRPIILMLHDGPEQNYTKSWNPQLEVFLENGIDVMQLNYAGSAGYGEKSLNQSNAAIPDIIKSVTYLSRKRKYKKIFLLGDKFGAGLALQAASLCDIQLNGLILLGYAGNVGGKGNITTNVLAFQGEQDNRCSPVCAKEKLEQYWDNSKTAEIRIVKKEGHIFRHIDTFSNVYSEIIDYVNKSSTEKTK